VHLRCISGEAAFDGFENGSFIDRKRDLRHAADIHRELAHDYGLMPEAVADRPLQL